LDSEDSNTLILGRRRLPRLRYFFPLLPFLALVAWGYTSTDHLQRSLQLLDQGDLNSAAGEARLALNSPSTRALACSVLGTIRLKQSRYGESIQFFHQALHLDPRLLGARINLGNAYLLQGKPDKARAMFGSALTLDPSNLNARFNLVKLEAASGRYRASLEAAQPILDNLSHSEEGLLALAQAYLGLHQKASAQALLPKWETLNGVAEQTSLSFASLFAKEELLQEAIEVLEKARAGVPASFDLALALGNCYFTKGDLKQAADSYESALHLKADCVPCMRQVAVIAERQGESDKAVAYLIRAKRLEPDNPEILFEFGKVCLTRNLIEDALPVLQRAVEQQPRNPSYTYVLASAYVAKKDFNTARELLDSLLKERPNDAVLNYAMGAILFLEVDLDNAERYLRKSISSNPNQLAAYYYLGLVVERKGEGEEAVRIFQDLLQAYPSHARTYEALGSILLKERKYTEAQQALEKAILLDSKSIQGHYQLGILLARIGQKEESSKHLETAQKLEAEEKKKTGVEVRILNPY
jgi:tetratricopeptide (TPR) repeat protein